MSAKTGIAPIGVYTNAGTHAQKVAVLAALIPDPDNGTGSSGTIAGGGNGSLNTYLDEMSPGAAVQLQVELIAMEAAFTGATGSYTVLAADVTATHATIVSGLADLTLANGSVTIWRAGTNVTAVAGGGITEPVAGTIQVASSGTYALTAGDIINWFARP